MVQMQMFQLGAENGGKMSVAFWLICFCLDLTKSHYLCRYQDLVS